MADRITKKGITGIQLGLVSVAIRRKRDVAVRKHRRQKFLRLRFRLSLLRHKSLQSLARIIHARLLPCPFEPAIQCFYPDGHAEATGDDLLVVRRLLSLCR